MLLILTYLDCFTCALHVHAVLKSFFNEYKMLHNVLVMDVIHVCMYICCDACLVVLLVQFGAIKNELFIQD